MLWIRAYAYPAKEAASWTGSIVHDKIGTILTTNEPHMDDPCPGIRKLQCNNPKEMVPFGSLNLDEIDEPSLVSVVLATNF